VTDTQIVAKWMASTLEAEGVLHQDDAVCEIERRFGAAFVYDSASGNLAINKKILSAFKKLTADWVVWERGERCWRLREEHDPPGRMTD
jgi:hypothetical protein